MTVSRLAWSRRALAALAVVFATAHAEKAYAGPGRVEAASAEAEDPAALAEESGEVGEDAEHSLEIVAIDIAGREQVAKRQIVDILASEGLEVGISVLWPEDERVVRARRRLAATGYFSRVTLRLVPADQGRERARLVVELEERGSLTIQEIYAGTSKLTPFHGGLEIHERNLFGRSVHVGAGAIWGTLPRGVLTGRQQQGYRAFLELPDLGHSPVGLLGSAYFISASEPYRVSGERDDPSPTRFHALDYNRLGGVLGLTIAFTPTLRLGLDYRFEGVGAVVPDDPMWSMPTGEERAIDLHLLDGRHRLATAEFSLAWDGRDQLAALGRGGRLRLDVELSSAAIASEYEYVKVQLGGAYSFRLPWGHWLTPSALGGQIAGDAPRFERFYPGDFHTWTPGREFDLLYSTRGPIDVFGTGVGGHDLAAFAGRLDLEYEIPLFRFTRLENVSAAHIYLNVGTFAVAGNEAEREQRRADGVNVAPLGFNADFGLRLETSLGQFEFSVGNTLRRLPL